LPLVAEVSAALPDFRLLLFGQGPERERFGQQVTAAGLDRCIRFCGYEPDWPALVPGLELLLHPARREGLGNVVLEAMAAGVPVVAAAAGGIADAIEPDVDGMLLSGHDTGAWSRAVLELLSRPAERERLAAAARRTVELRFTIGAMATSYFSLYDDVRDIRR
jgi:glycosyltransferase involved in cell wall biosynthesis